MNEFEFMKSHIAEKRYKELEKEARKEIEVQLENIARVRSTFLFINDEVIKDKLKSQLERDILNIRRYEHGDDEESKDFEISLVWDMEKEAIIHNRDCNDSLDNLKAILREDSKIPESMITKMSKSTQNIFNVINEIIKEIYENNKANLIQSYLDTLKFKDNPKALLPSIESFEFKKMFKRLNEHSYDTHMVLGLSKVQESYEPGIMMKGVSTKGEYKLSYELSEHADVLNINPKRRVFRCERHRHKQVINGTGDIPFEDVNTVPNERLRGFRVKEIIEAMDRLDKMLEELGVSNER